MWCFFEFFFPKCIRHLCTVVGVKHKFKKERTRQNKASCNIKYPYFQCGSVCICKAGACKIQTRFMRAVEEQDSSLS